MVFLYYLVGNTNNYIPDRIANILRVRMIEALNEHKIHYNRFSHIEKIILKVLYLIVRKSLTVCKSMICSFELQIKNK
jgi:hypothetical protein